MITLVVCYLVGVVATIALIVIGLASMVSLRARLDIGRHFWANASLLGFVVVFWFLPWGSTLGAIDGSIDSWRHTWQLNCPPRNIPTRERFVFSRVLRDRYGVFCSPVHGCIVLSRNDVTFEQAHDAMIVPAIVRHFGFDIFADCEQAAHDETQR